MKNNLRLQIRTASKDPDEVCKKQVIKPITSTMLYIWMFMFGNIQQWCLNAWLHLKSSFLQLFGIKEAIAGEEYALLLGVRY